MDTRIFDKTILEDMENELEKYELKIEDFEFEIQDITDYSTTVYKIMKRVTITSKKSNIARQYKSGYATEFPMDFIDEVRLNVFQTRE